jgi:hypothetical protein
MRRAVGLFALILTFASVAIPPTLVLAADSYQTSNGPRTAAQLHDELAIAGYGGPWDVDAMLAAYSRAAPPPPPATTIAPPFQGLAAVTCDEETWGAYAARLCLYAASGGGYVSAKWVPFTNGWVMVAFISTPNADATLTDEGKRLLNPSVPTVTTPSLTRPSTPSVTGGTSGVVVLKKSGCDYFVVASGSGDYAVFEWYGGYEAEQGDQVMGNWSTFGFKDILVGSTGRAEHVWVEDYALPPTRATDLFHQKCPRS